MGHLIIVTIAITLIIGAAAIINAVQFYKTNKHPLLKSYIIYVALYNSVTFLNFFSQYVLINISTLSSWTTFLILIIVMGLIGFSIMYYNLYLYILIVFELTAKNLSNNFKKYYLIIYLGWIVLFGIGAIDFIIQGEKLFLLKLGKYTNDIVIIPYLVSTLYLLFNAKKIDIKEKRTSVYYFGFLFLTFSFIDISVFVLPNGVNHLLLTFSGLLLNLTFLLYFKPFSKLYFGFSDSKKTNIPLPEDIYVKFGISPREKEIIELIINGLSNKEIEEKLFISSSTIKNHIYHIFKKTGVNSRTQLINLIIKS